MIYNERCMFSCKEKIILKKGRTLRKNERFNEGKTLGTDTKFRITDILGNLLQLTYSLVDTRIVGSFLERCAWPG